MCGPDHWKGDIEERRGLQRQTLSSSNSLPELREPVEVQHLRCFNWLEVSGVSRNVASKKESWKVAGVIPGSFKLSLLIPNFFFFLADQEQMRLTLVLS